MTQNDHNLEGTIDELLGQHADKELQALLAETKVEDIAATMNRLTHGKRKIFRMLSDEQQRNIIWDLRNYVRQHVVNGLSNTEVRKLLTGMDSDDAADVVYLLPLRRRPGLLKILPKEDSAEIKDILQYPENSAGSVMQKELIKVPEYFSVLDCIKRIQRLYKEGSNMHFIFVVDQNSHFLGYVPIEKLVIAKPNTRVKSIISGNTTIPVKMDQEEVVHIFKDLDLPVLPVVNEKEELVGTISVDDVVDILEAEQSEDVYQMAGVSHDENVFDPALVSYKRRLFWLAINLLTAILAAWVVSLFQGTIQKLVILAAYMPIVAGMGGNATTQTVTIMVRGIALKEVQLKDAWKVLRKEIAIGIINGILLGIVVGLISYFYNGSIMLGVVIAAAMLINLLIAGISGTLVPLTLKLFKLDPALVSTVFVTTCTDVGGFLAFLGLATILL